MLKLISLLLVTTGISVAAVIPITNIDYGDDSIVKAIRAVPTGEPIIFKINSNGGSTVTQIAVINEIRKGGHKFTAEVHVAHSAAAFISLASNVIVCKNNRYMILHVPYTNVLKSLPGGKLNTPILKELLKMDEPFYQHTIDLSSPYLNDLEFDQLKSGLDVYIRCEELQRRKEGL